MIGAIQQCLSMKEELDKQWKEDELRVEQGKDSEWTHELSMTWWKLEKNTTYFIEVAEELVCQTGCFSGLSKPYTAETCLRKYNAIGLKLRLFLAQTKCSNPEEHLEILDQNLKMLSAICTLSVTNVQMAQSIFRFWAVRPKPYCPKSQDVLGHLYMSSDKCADGLEHIEILGNKA